ncbi:MAG: hypothetical protein EPO68_03430 [Planctomycetota bacterium]|nr:MAG: hypothetical protein EPO68_03430 [Planctomycetota bacterium]
MKLHRQFCNGLASAILGYTLSAQALVAPAAGALTPPPAPALSAAPQAFVSIATYSDIYQSTVGVPVLIEDASVGDSLLTTDANGQTAFVTSTLGATLVVTLGEQWAPEGVLIGQRRLVTMPWSPTPSDRTYLLHETTQPLALPFKWPPASGVAVTAAPYHTRWLLQLTMNPPKHAAFTGLAAPLLTRREIDSTLWYNDAPQTLDVTDFRVGTLLRTADVELPHGAFTLEIDCRGHGFMGVPNASCIILASADKPTAPTLTAQVVGWNDEIARVWLDGDFELGDNMILLSQGPSERTVRYLAKPPSLGGATDAAGGRGRGASGGGATDSSQDCVPPEPTPPPSWSCDPEDIKSKEGCAPAVLQGGACRTETKKISDVACGTPGSTESVTSAGQWSFSLSLKCKIKGVDVTGTGAYTDVDSSTSTLGFGAGNGCGECKAKYRHHLICLERWLFERGHWSWSWSEWEWYLFCYADTGESVCVEQMTSEGACSRTCN